MTWEAWATLGTLGGMVALLVRNVAPPDIILLGTLGVLVTLGLYSDAFPGAGQAVAGFGNDGLLTVGLLFVVAGGLAQTGAMSLLSQPLLGRPKGTTSAQVRLMLPVAGLSAFLNNTPVVAMFMPVVDEWTKKIRVSGSKLFIPLSYASILGGVCTLIGTSTNLVVHGMMVADPDLDGIGMFEITWIGLPALALGLVYILVFSRWLLPDREPAISTEHDPRRYAVEMRVDPKGPLVGKSIEEAGLRQLPGLFLAEIDREGQVLPAVSPTERLQADDHLVFVGVVASVADLQKVRGLKPATDQVFKLDAPRSERWLIEAVVSDSCPLVGRTIREGHFRTRYKAVVLAVARGGRRLRGKIGDVMLQPGDTLLLEAHPTFVQTRRYSRDFYLVSRVEDFAHLRYDRAGIALAIMAAMVGLVALEVLTMLHAALLAGVIMVATRCITAAEARRGIDWQVLITIGAAIGIGAAIEGTGLALEVALTFVRLAGDNPILLLAVVYATTTLFTELITNNAAAVLIFPIAKATALSAGLDFMPFAIAIMVAASASFSTPIGYQTNLMVYGPGGYRFTDYLRFGLPLNLLIMTTTVVLAPQIWPFQG